MPENSTETHDVPSLKKIEQYSRAVCQQLDTDNNKHKKYTRSEVIYGLAAFIVAVLTATNDQSHSQ